MSSKGIREQIDSTLIIRTLDLNRKLDYYNMCCICNCDIYIKQLLLLKNKRTSDASTNNNI